jgi:pimeloyl-ACP methyl ester carboxylesterase
MNKTHEALRFRDRIRHLARLPLIIICLLALSFVLMPATVAPAQTSKGVKPTIVLVHGAWADGSSWNEVSSRLQSRGYTVDVPPNTLRGVSDDASYLASYLATISGPIVLVGHSYGGFVISNAATGNANVKALVYVDAFIPAQGETLLSLTSPGSCLGGNPADTFNVVPFSGGEDLYVKTAPNNSFVGFDNCFANRIPAKKAAVLAADQRPLSAAVLTEPSGPPAWASIPSWSVIGTEDNVLPPSAQLSMSNRAHAQITEVPAGHLSMITQPQAVTKVILRAVHGAS